MDKQRKAHAAVSYAIATGKLPPITDETLCVDCGATATQYDHRDYDRPLEVQPVCQKCNVLRGSAENWDHVTDTVVFNFRAKKSLLSRLRDAAQRERRTMANMANVLIEKALEDNHRG